MRRFPSSRGRKWTVKGKKSPDPYYDLFEDLDLIISSFRAQYGVKIHSAEFKEMRWKEFRALLSGIGPDTPLGRIVAIRAEDDAEILKHFTAEQRRIRDEWRLRGARNVSEGSLADILGELERAFTAMAGGGPKLKK